MVIIHTYDADATFADGNLRRVVGVLGVNWPLVYFLLITG